MRHTHILSFAFSLQALQAYLLLQLEYSHLTGQTGSHRTDIQAGWGFFPFV